MSDAFNRLLNLEQPDAAYQALIEAHQDLSLVQSHELNARLVLMMSNQIGGLAILKDIFKLAREDVLSRSGDPDSKQLNLKQEVV